MVAVSICIPTSRSRRLTFALLLTVGEPLSGHSQQVQDSCRSPGESASLRKSLKTSLSLPGGSAGKESACNAGDPDSVLGSGGSPAEGKGCPLQSSWASLAAQTVKNQPAVPEDWVPSLGREDPLEKRKAAHSKKNPVDTGAWWATVQGVTKGWA